MPLSQQHTVFVYLSDPFFRLLIGPHYRIEMTRRMRAAAEIDVVQLAQLASAAEGKPARSIRRLIERDLLPADFGRRPDGSRVVVSRGEVRDSLRGAYGSFLPVPDVKIPAATPSEVRAYEEFARRYASYWQRVDPVIVGIHRRKLPEENKERVVLDVHVTPYARSHYEVFNLFLSAADKQCWGPVPGDVVSLQVNLQGQKLAAGVRDYLPEFVIASGDVRHTAPRDEESPLYLILPKENWLFGTLKPLGPPNERGNSAVSGSILLGGSEHAWMRPVGEYRLVAANQETIEEIAPHANLVEAEREAQGRLWIGDLAEARVSTGLNAEGFLRARKISMGNTAFMHALMQQLDVPAAEAPAVAERLLHARLVCPLGGTYELQSDGASPDRLRSTAWRHESLHQITRVPEGFRSPLLDWFAGVWIELNIDWDTLSTHVELDVRTSRRRSLRPSAITR